jgi:hypothetical protein
MSIRDREEDPSKLPPPHLARASFAIGAMRASPHNLSPRPYAKPARPASAILTVCARQAGRADQALRPMESRGRRRSRVLPRRLCRGGFRRWRAPASSRRRASTTMARPTMPAERGGHAKPDWGAIARDLSRLNPQPRTRVDRRNTTGFVDRFRLTSATPTGSDRPAAPPRAPRPQTRSSGDGRN